MSDLHPQIRDAKVKRRAGYAILGAMILYLSVPMIIAVVSGVSSGQIWDPYTHQHLSEKESAARWCFDEASRLLGEAGRMEKIDRKWDERAKQWTGKCRRDHPELHQVLVATRTKLRNSKK